MKADLFLGYDPGYSREAGDGLASMSTHGYAIEQLKMDSLLRMDFKDRDRDSDLFIRRQSFNMSAFQNCLQRSDNNNSSA